MATQYHTYTPKKGGWKLPAGQALKFAQGKGYYSESAPARAAAARAAAPPASFGQAIQNEGINVANQAQLGAENDAARAQRDAAVKAIQFQFNDPANPYSTAGELGRMNKSNVANMMAQRAARGVQTSGGTTLAQLDIGHDFGRSMYDATNQATGQVGSLDANLANTLRQNAYAGSEETKAAMQRLIDAGIIPAGSGGVSRKPQRRPFRKPRMLNPDGSFA